MPALQIHEIACRVTPGVARATAGAESHQPQARSEQPICYSSPVRRIRRNAWLLVLLSAVLQVLSFPLPGLYFLGWVALAPLIVAILHARSPEALQLDESQKLIAA